MSTPNMQVENIKLNKGDKKGAWTYASNHVAADITPYVAAASHRNIESATMPDGRRIRYGTVTHVPEQPRVVKVYHCDELVEVAEVKDLHDARKVIAWWAGIPPR